MAEQIQFNLNMDGDPQDARSVGEIREELERLEDTLDNTTQGTDEFRRTVAKIGDLEGELEKVDRAIEAMNPERKAQVIGDAVTGMTGGFQAAVSSVELFGIENEKVLESLQRVNAVMGITDGITAFSEKIPAMKTLIATMPRLTSALKGARVGFQGLSAATKALGIGLLVSAIALLVTHWEDVQEVITDLFPGLQNTSELFGRLKDGAIALGSALLKYVASPLKALIQVIQGDFSAAKDTLVDGFNVIGNTAEEFNKKQEERAEERKRAELEAATETLEREREILEARGKSTEEIDKRIFENKKMLYEEDSEEFKNLMHEQRLEEAKRAKELESELEKQREVRKAHIEKLKELRAIERGEDEILDEDIDVELGQGEDGEELLIFNGEVVTREEFELMQERGSLALIQGLQNREITKEEFRLKQLENERSAIEAELSIAEEGSKRHIELQSELAQAQMDISDAKTEAEISNAQKVSETLMQLSRFAGEQTAVGKALGVVSATIDTYVGANKALAQGGIFGIASAAAVIATGLSNVRQILSTQVPSIQGQPVGTPAASPLGSQGQQSQATAPQFNETGVNTVNTVQSERDRELANRPTKAFVTETDISETQNRVSEIERQSTF